MKCGSHTMHWITRCLWFVITVLIHENDGSWVDPDTIEADQTLISFVDKREYKLVFSDEFNVDGRTFHDGRDPRWTAMNKDDYTNFALHYYNADLAITKNGVLNISTIVSDVSFDTHNPEKIDQRRQTKNYQSGMINGWNKFCFTGGIVEISAKLPGKYNAGGLWPAMWLLGNLARATYVGSSNNVWPWSYDSCSKPIQAQQAFSACNLINHYNMKPHQGRGAPEIDILEAMAGVDEELPGTIIKRPYFSSSFQVAPAIQDYRPVNAMPPEPGRWYDHDLEYGDTSKTDINVFFYGMTLEGTRPEMTYMADAISANTQLTETYFNSLHKYRLEWVPGEQGYIRWYLDDEFIYGIRANALNKTGAIIPEEPMYILLNTAISSTWGFPQPCPDGCACDCFDCRKEECACAIPAGMCDNFPAYLNIDYVRVFQASDDETQVVGCSTPTHPTSTYIKGHPELYMSEKDKIPLQPLSRGNQDCVEDQQCGQGSCQQLKCKCHHGFVGPNCLAAEGYDPIIWEHEAEVRLSGMFVPVALLLLLGILATALAAIVAYKYLHDRNARGGWRIGAMGRYTKVVEMPDRHTVEREAQAAAAALGNLSQEGRSVYMNNPGTNSSASNKGYQRSSHDEMARDD